MSDTSNSPNTGPADDGRSGTSSASGRPCRSKRRGLVLIAVALAGGLAGAFATKAVGHGFGWRGHFGHGHGFSHARGPMGFIGGPIDEKRALKRAGRVAGHLGVEVEATPDQQAKLNTIAEGLVSDMLPLRQKLRDARKRGVDLMTAAVVDRPAIEAFRAEQLTTADQMSQRLTTALADAAEVLTPVQRAKLSDRVAKWREHRGWFQRWKRDGSHRDREDD